MKRSTLKWVSFVLAIALLSSFTPVFASGETLAKGTVAMVPVKQDSVTDGQETPLYAEDTASYKDEVTLYKEEVLRLVNAERAAAGLEGFKHNEKIEPLADIRAAECDTLFSHTRPDNTKWSTVFTNNKVAYRLIGENLSSGASTPERVVKAWLKSAPHRANILSEDFTYISIGYYKNADGRIFCSQLFFTPPAEV